MARRIMILAGGTGGHVYPALAVAKMLADSGNQVFWMGTQKGLEARVVPANNFEIDWLSVSGIRGKRGLSLVKAPFLLVYACIQAALILCRRKPHVVIGMGGFVSGPGGLMAWLMRVPLVLHEQNTIPGTTNRILASVANRVLEAFPGSFDQSVSAVCTGNPVRVEILQLYKETKNRPNKTPSVLILGGSLGARRLNEIVPRVIGNLNRKVSVFHQSGPAMLESTKNAYRLLQIDATVKPFVEDMPDVYQWADLVICRAGAMTVSELAIVGLPSILVPFPYAIDDHQTQNARYLVDAEAAILVPESQTMEEEMTNALAALISDPKRLRSMADAALNQARPDATQSVCENCLGEAA